MPAKTKLTPAMEQYMHFKRRHKDAILFFRMGDFYEMFFDDAKEVSKLLGLTLTARNHGKTTGSVPLAGLPHHAMEGYLAKLIQLGRKVAICEQVEDPKQAKGVVKREVVQVVSPGTALSDSMLDQQRNNFLVGLWLHPDRIGLASIDLSTGDFTLDEVDTASLADELQSLAPAELLIAEGADEKWVEQLQATLPRVALSRIDDWHFAADTAYEVLTNQLQVQSLKGFGCDGMDIAVRAGGATIAYLRDNQRGAVQHINRLQRKHREDFALIDATAQRNLELLANQHDGDRGNTLLEVLDRTCTPMGARLLRQWIMQPLKNPKQIEARLEAVDALLGQRENRRTLRQLLGQVGDLERLMARICCLRANGRDMVSLANSLSVSPDISSAVAAVPSSLLQELRGEGLPDVSALVDEILGALVDEPPTTLTEGSLIRDGYHEQVDELRQIASGGKTYIARLQTTERERTGIASLKIGYNQIFGYYIEISKANLDKAPEKYHRKQTLANAERFITPELKEYEEKVIGAEDRLKDLENELFLKLRARAAVWTPQVQQIARTLARMDTLCSFAETAEGESYVRPEIDDSGEIEIRDGRHPVVERQLRDGRFVPNDMQLDSAGAQIMLITGPNMAGKSTIIRQVGLIVLMGQIGSFVPARSAKIGVVDRIFTRVGASDNLARGESTFMVEMNEAANILNNTTAKSLILMDELGRGTSTFDGLSIAWAIVEFLHQRTDAHPRTLFATHYHEMTELESHLERVVNFNVQVREEGDRVIFLHRLAPGPTDQSYGINVAQMAGMPQQVVSRAKEILARLEKEQIDTDNIHDTHAPQPAIPEPQNESAPAEIESPPISAPTKAPAQLNLFPDASDASLTQELLALDLSQITPLQALLKLNEWKETIREESQRQ